MSVGSSGRCVAWAWTLAGKPSSPPSARLVLFESRMKLEGRPESRNVIDLRHLPIHEHRRAARRHERRQWRAEVRQTIADSPVGSVARSIRDLLGRGG